MVNSRLKKLYSYAPAAVILLGILFANVHKSVSVFIVEEKSTTSKLYFAGIASPIDTITVVTPARGIITTVGARYGERVKKEQLLFTIKSSQMETNFRKTVEVYIKAKSTYQRMLFESNGNAELFKLGLVSKVDYLNKQEQLKSGQLELWDAEMELKKIIENTSVLLPVDIKNLSMEKIEMVRNVLQQPLAEIQITARSDGILFFPSKALGGKGSGKDDNSTKVAKGDLVEEGQILAFIANTTGLGFEINVNETNFQDVKIGQKATIKGNAFAPLELTGTVVSINHQANNAEPGVIPSYRARIIVPRLTDKERQAIQIGMSAEVALTQTTHLGIEIPISALFFKNNQYWVKVINPNDQSIKEVPVKTGDTTVDSIQITNGLVPGEHIVLPD